MEVHREGLTNPLAFSYLLVIFLNETVKVFAAKEFSVVDGYTVLCAASHPASRWMEENADKVVWEGMTSKLLVATMSGNRRLYID